MGHNTLIHYRNPGVEKNKVMTNGFDLIVFDLIGSPLFKVDYIYSMF